MSPLLPHILAAVAKAYGIRMSLICSRVRTEPIAEARQMCYLRMYESGITQMDIGRFMEREHSTVSSGIRRIRGLLDTDISTFNFYNLTKQYEAKLAMAHQAKSNSSGVAEPLSSYQSSLASRLPKQPKTQSNR